MSSTLDAILLGARLAFEDYHLPHVPLAIEVGARLALSEYPPVRLYRWFKGRWIEAEDSISSSIKKDLEQQKRRLGSELRQAKDAWKPAIGISLPSTEPRYYVRMREGARIQFSSRESAITYANSDKVRGKCWIEDSDGSTRESVLFIVSYDSHNEKLYHAAAQDRSMIDYGTTAICGSPGRVVSMECKGWLDTNRYCAKCFPERAGLRRYVYGSIHS